MSLFSFVKKNKEKFSLVFSINSGSVCGGMIRYTEKAGEDMVFYAKEKIPLQKIISSIKHLDSMKKAISTVASRLRNEGLKNQPTKTKKIPSIDKVYCIFSSPWSISQTKTIKIKESKSFLITENLIKKLITDQEEKVRVSISSSGKTIERKIIQIKLNGYPTNNFYNKTAKELEVTVLFTVVPEEVLTAINNAIFEVFYIKETWCHSLSLSSFSVIRDLFPQKNDFVKIHISEEMTDFSVVKDDIITDSASIPFGRNHFIRHVSSTLNTTEDIADSMIRLHCLGQSDDLASLKLGVVLDDLAKKWQNEVFEVLNNVREKSYLPETFFLVADKDLTRFLSEKLQKEKVEVLLVENKKIKSAKPLDDLSFSLALMFLDNLYKI